MAMHLYAAPPVMPPAVKELEAQLALVGEVFREGDLVFREGELRGYCSRCWERRLYRHMGHSGCLYCEFGATG